MIVTGSASDWEYVSLAAINLLSMEGRMIDALFNVAAFATLVLCIVGSVHGRVSEFRDAKGRLDCGLADVRFTPKKRTLLGDS